MTALMIRLGRKQHDWLHLRLIHLLLFPDVLETIANAARKQGRTTDWLCSFFGEKASKLCESIITQRLAQEFFDKALAITQWGITLGGSAFVEGQVLFVRIGLNSIEFKILKKP